MLQKSKKNSSCEPTLQEESFILFYCIGMSSDSADYLVSSVSASSGVTVSGTAPL